MLASDVFTYLVGCNELDEELRRRCFGAIGASRTCSQPFSCQGCQARASLLAIDMAENAMAGLGKSPNSYCNSMEGFRRFGSRNPLNLLDCHTPPLGTTTKSDFDSAGFFLKKSPTEKNWNQTKPQAVPLSAAQYLYPLADKYMVGDAFHGAGTKADRAQVVARARGGSSTAARHE